MRHEGREVLQVAPERVHLRRGLANGRRGCQLHRSSSCVSPVPPARSRSVAPRLARIPVGKPHGDPDNDVGDTACRHQPARGSAVSAPPICPDAHVLPVPGHPIALRPVVERITWVARCSVLTSSRLMRSSTDQERREIHSLVPPPAARAPSGRGLGNLRDQLDLMVDAVVQRREGARAVGERVDLASRSRLCTRGACCALDEVAVQPFGPRPVAGSTRRALDHVTRLELRKCSPS